MKNSNTKKQLNAEDLLNVESDIIKRIAEEVIDSEISEIVSGHTSSTTGHRSGSSHVSHASAMKENLNSKNK
jgi:hypothetical protein